MKSTSVTLTLILSLMVGCSKIDKVKRAIGKVEKEHSVSFKKTPLEEYGKQVPNSFVYRLSQPFGNGIEIKGKLKDEISKAVNHLPNESKESEPLYYLDGTLNHLYDHYEWVAVDYEITFEVSYQETESVELTIWIKNR